MIFSLFFFVVVVGGGGEKKKKLMNQSFLSPLPFTYMVVEKCFWSKELETKDPNTAGAAELG